VGVVRGLGLLIGQLAAECGLVDPANLSNGNMVLSDFREAKKTAALGIQMYKIWSMHQTA
jgi:hypothetical protein